MNQIAEIKKSLMITINHDFSEDMVLEGVIIILDPALSVAEVAEMCEKMAEKNVIDALNDYSYSKLKEHLGSGAIIIRYDEVPEIIIPSTSTVEHKIVLPYYIIKEEKR
jgi:hypothetical protein